MTANVGGIDRIARIAAGIAIIILGGVYQSWWGAVGLVPLATGLFRWCGLYPLLGISTCQVTGAPPAEASSPEASAPDSDTARENPPQS